MNPQVYSSPCKACLGFFALLAFLAAIQVAEVNAAAPVLQSATYSIKEANLFGNKYRFAIYEAEFDQEIYYLTNPTCPCVGSSQSCPLSISGGVAPTVDESQFNVTVLREGVWFYGASSSGTTVYYKFEIPVDAAVPCPVVQLESETMLGTASLLISNKGIPTTESHVWQIDWNYKDYLTLCPFSPLVTYGTYYLAYVDQLNSAVNRWGIRYSIVNSKDCPATTTAVPYADTNWVSNGEAVTLNMAALAHRYLKFYYELPAVNAPESRCFQFSAAVSGNTLGTNPDLYISTSNPYPNETTTVDWVSATSGDDSITTMICLPEDSNSTTLYIGIYNRAVITTSYLFVATGDVSITSAPLTNLLYSQSAQSLNFGASPKLRCDSQVFTCRAPASENCDTSGSDCCYVFANLPPTARPNPIIPWNAFDTSLPQINQIPWDEPLSLQPGKLSWMLYLSRSDPTSATEYVAADPGSCVVEMGSMLVNSNSDLLTGPISFSPKDPGCDNSAYSLAVDEISYIVEQMSSLTDYGALSLQHLRLNILAMSDSLLGCDTLLNSLTTSKMTSRDYTSFGACFQDPGTDAWGTDPCCNRTLALTSCCASDILAVASSNYDASNDNSITSTCANAECAKRAMQTFLSSENSINNLATGCSAQFKTSASLELKARLESTPTTCRQAYLTDTLLGIACLNDTGCLAGKTCNMSTLRCDHDLADVAECISETLDDTVARALYNALGATTLEVSANNTMGLMEANDYETSCMGDGSIEFLTAWHYSLVDPNCQDNCPSTPICIDESCIVNALCNSSVTSSACPRYWNSVKADNLGCLAHNVCNWMICPSGSTDLECANLCVNATLSTSTCVNCATGGESCIEVTGWNETRCNDGLCSLGSLINSATCLASGVCDASCATCDTQAGCENHGMCSDSSYLSNYITMLGSDGVCIRSPDYNADGAICPNGTVVVPSGCVNLNLTTEDECYNNATDGGDYLWTRLATNQSACLAHGTACRNEHGVLLPLSVDACNLCSSATVAPYYTWTAGTWSPGRVQKLKWVERSYSSAFSTGPQLDLQSIQTRISSAVADVLTYPFITEALCRYTTSYAVAGSLVCDCSANSPGNCFSSISNQQVGADRACHGISSELNTRIGSLVIGPDAYPSNSDCQLVTLASTSASEFELDESHSLSSAIFQSSPTNSFWVVRRQGLDVAVGQLVSGAVNVSLGDIPLSGHAYLCIYVESDIGVASIAKVYALAKLIDGVVQAFQPTSTMNFTGTAVCDYITETGAYFATKLVNNYQTEEFDSRSIRIQSRIGGVLYFLTAGFAVFQGIILGINWKREKIIRLKIIFVCIVCLNCLVRGVYMFIPSTNFVGSESIQFIIFELPSFLFFSVYLSIIYLWVNVVLKASSFGKRKGFLGDAESVSRDIFVVTNIIMYTIFIIFMFLISILPSLESPSVCFLGAQNNSLRNSSFYRVKLAYWIIVATLCFLVSLGFIVGASSLLRIVLSVEKTGINKHNQGGARSRRMNKLILISIVAGVCTIFLLIRSSLFLYAAVTSKTINVMVFVLLEVIPSLGLLYYLRPYWLMGLFKSSKTSSRGSSSARTNTETATDDGQHKSRSKTRSHSGRS